MRDAQRPEEERAIRHSAATMRDAQRPEEQRAIRHSAATMRDERLCGCGCNA
jgi:hypothetical protein